MHFKDFKTSNRAQHISLANDHQIKSPPFKVKTYMLWTTCQNFTKIGWLTNRKMQFYENCANER